jgi:hypothetical protein
VVDTAELVRVTLVKVATNDVVPALPAKDPTYPADEDTSNESRVRSKNSALVVRANIPHIEAVQVIATPEIVLLFPSKVPEK